MKASDLPSLHTFIGNGNQLKNEIAKAINSCALYAKKAKTEPASLDKLDALFDAAKTQLALILTIPTGIVASASDKALSLASDTSEQIVVTATGISGATANVAPASNYVSSDPAVLTVSATGLVTAVAVGSANVLVTYQDTASAPLAFTVAA